jgi:ketosteroid isomerase-like protein
MENKHLIEAFYKAFQQRDAAGMAACYHEQIVFEDPAFGQLKGKDAGLMWQMLCENGKDLKLDFSGVTADQVSGKAHWEAWYTFSKTGKKVHNKIDAAFEFKEGKIIKHTDQFNLHRWATQALGWQGWLLGGTGFFKKKLQQQTMRTLEKYKLKAQ